MAKKTRAKTTETSGGLIRSFRVSSGLKQHELCKKAGLSSDKNPLYNTPISRYERGGDIPTIARMYIISKCLPGLDRDILFNFALKERYQRFIDKEYKSYYNSYIKKMNYFYREKKSSRTVYRLHKFSKLLKKCRIKRGVTYSQMVKSFQERKDINHKYSVPQIAVLMGGRACPTVKDIKNFATYFNLDAFELFSLMIEEKAITLAADMKLCWEKYKKDKDNETKTVESKKAYA